MIIREMQIKTTMKFHLTLVRMDTINKSINIIQRSNSRLEEHKNQVKDLEYKKAKDTLPEKQEEKRIQKVEDSVRIFWDNFKHTNIRIMGVPEEEREQDTENLSFRIEGQLKSFTDQKKLMEFITTKPVLYDMLKGIL
uniref:L1 transposable element dsRBD-like domain-containing protein n=1 Tax=Pipistrellus kuhlii TaxID=59472 RepID=A0A7J8A7L5_PIPKU|nr:hypothetical protein mPipKuh1_008929 [Pipistrellus kuhlii]